MQKYINSVVDELVPHYQKDTDPFACQIHEYLNQFFPISSNILQNDNQLIKKQIDLHFYITNTQHLITLINVQSMLMNQIAKMRYQLTVEFMDTASSDALHIQKLGFVVKQVQKCDCYIQLGQRHDQKSFIMNSLIMITDQDRDVIKRDSENLSCKNIIRVV